MANRHVDYVRSDPRANQVRENQKSYVDRTRAFASNLPRRWRVYHGIFGIERLRSAINDLIEHTHRNLHAAEPDVSDISEAGVVTEEGADTRHAKYRQGQCAIVTLLLEKLYVDCRSGCALSLLTKARYHENAAQHATKTIEYVY